MSNQRCALVPDVRKERLRCVEASDVGCCRAAEEKIGEYGHESVTAWEDSGWEPIPRREDVRSCYMSDLDF